MSVLRSFGLSGACISSAPLRGGRTSDVYRLAAPDRAGTLVLKVSRPDAQTPLFDNRPNDEWAILCALSSTRIAPVPVCKTVEADGTHLLIYQFEAGTSGVSDAPALAALLRSVHASPPPEHLPSRSGGAADLMAEAERMCTGAPLPRALSALRPTLPKSAAHLRCLVHRDPIASNIVTDGSGTPLLIDWQCPASGDPVEDIAHATSPAMSYVYGSKDPFCAREVLDAYGDIELSRRADALLPVYRWRMICYCHWKATRGAQVYADAMEREVEALKSM